MGKIAAEPAAVARYCRGCGYNLFGLETPRCPECGREFSFTDPTTTRKAPKKSAWRWVRRAVAILLLLVLPYAGMIGWYYRGWKQEQPVRERFGRTNGSVKFVSLKPAIPEVLIPRQWRWMLERIATVGWYGGPTPPTDADLVICGRCSQLTNLTLWDSKVTDAGIASLSRLEKLDRIRLVGQGITDRGAALLARHKTLVSVELWNCTLTDAGTLALATLPKLNQLIVGSDGVTGLGLNGLKDVSALVFLELRSANIHPDTIGVFARFAQLNALGLRGHGWTADDEQRLAAALPGCAVFFNYRLIKLFPLVPSTAP